MLTQLTPSAQEALALARDEAHRLRHEYIGTEHVLLGLLAERSSVAVSVLNTFNVSADAVRHEIERLVQLGPEGAVSGDLPYTPRAKRTFDHAAREANAFNQTLIGVEHLLLGLMLEREGIAAMALENLGVKLSDVTREAFKIRLTQMVLVERAVRPVQATLACKRRMREELLTHLTAIYEEEFARDRNSSAAMKRAQERFGDSAELARELTAAQPATERIGCVIERWFAWRAPESITRYLGRQALVTLGVLAGVCWLAIVIGIVKGYSPADWKALRPFGVAALLAPAMQFMLGQLYFKLRGKLLGAFGQRKSLPQAMLLDATIALVVFSSLWAFTVAATWDVAQAVPFLIPFLASGVAVAIGYFFLARFRGPTEIRDTLWAILDLNDPNYGGFKSGSNGSSVEPA